MKEVRFSVIKIAKFIAEEKPVTRRYNRGVGLALLFCWVFGDT